ncbi:hypothetical protein [Neorhodopirellula lusitana]|uniref:hypothetical protein n=1 Tax=Neorhodopirellula lusitana TaxID=445327 RepID=UPI003211DD18
MEVSVLWHTEGKGDEDLGVHFFQRYDASELRNMVIGESQPIQCRLPASPLSYRGTLLKIQWGVRVRVFVADGPEAVAEHPFYVVARKSDPTAVVQATDVVPERIDDPAARSHGLRLPQSLKRWPGASKVAERLRRKA